MRANIRMLLLPAVLLLLATLAWADDAPTGGGWFGRWFAPSNTTTKKTPDRNDGDSGPIASLPTKAADDAGPSASPRARAEAAYHRRDAVCLKLRNVANAANDAALLEKVEQLEARNWELYCRRTATPKVAVKEK
jgi:hypothetical protein